MKIAMDSSVLDLYERMLDLNDRQSKKLPPGKRYSRIEQEAFDIIDALENIHKSRAHFCLLPSNIDELQRIKRPKLERFLGKCCEGELDSQKQKIRLEEMNASNEDLERYMLLAEAEECGVNILLTRYGSFKQKLQQKAKNNIKICHPIDYAKEIAK
jgi:hypothetical protein